MAKGLGTTTATTTLASTRRGWRRGRRGLISAGFIALAVLSAPVVRASPGPAASIPPTRVSGPVRGGLHGRLFGSSLVDLRPWGYREDEYFASGIASGGSATAIPTLVSTGSQPSPYRTRLVVRRPAGAAAFNGTVLVEWLNVTSSQDYDADWSEGYREILRGGYAYIGVSVQQVGVQALQRWDPVRYGRLQHPGDGYAAAIYAQVLEAVRHPNGTNPLAGLHVQRVIADGHSQSGINLHLFVDGVQSRAHLADGFLVRGDGTTNFDFGRLRTPVLQYQSEAEIGGPVGRLQNAGRYVPPAPDSMFYRLWQVAGATHTGQEGIDYVVDEFSRDDFNQRVTWDETGQGRYDGEGHGLCSSSVGVGPFDRFPQWYTLDAAIHALNGWVSTGRPPVPAPRVAVDPSGHILRDGAGNAMGGVRDPVVDIPIATYHGDEGCPLSGVTVSLPGVTLAHRYPTRTRYVSATRAAALRAQGAGWLRPYDASDLLARAEAAPLGR